MFIYFYILCFLLLYAIVTTVHKNGATSDPNNFRPISLTATCCKVMERVFNSQLLRYLLKHELISISTSMALLSANRFPLTYLNVWMTGLLT